ncbi:MAG: septum formation initiator family protein [Anaerolineae bacterium]|nr:septum formation initiator family protein [Anaerolineae bacterium]MDW8100970.1 septum formation initiator family protein [Anaerolineae bacterium]
MLQRRMLAAPSAITWWPSSFRRAVPEEVYRFVHYLIFLMVICAALYLYVRPASQISATRLQIAALQAEHARLQRENAELTRQLAIYTDIRRVEARARELGYRPPDSRMFVRITMAPPTPVPIAKAKATSPSVQWREAVDWLTRRLEWSTYTPLERLEPHQ